MKNDWAQLIDEDSGKETGYEILWDENAFTIRVKDGRWDIGESNEFVCFGICLSNGLYKDIQSNYKAKTLSDITSAWKFRNMFDGEISLEREYYIAIDDDEYLHYERCRLADWS